MAHFSASSLAESVFSMKTPSSNTEDNLARAIAHPGPASDGTNQGRGRLAKWVWRRDNLILSIDHHGLDMPVVIEFPDEVLLSLVLVHAST